MRFMYLVGQRYFSSPSLGLDLCCRTSVLSTKMTHFSMDLGLSFLFCFLCSVIVTWSEPSGTPEQFQGSTSRLKWGLYKMAQHIQDKYLCFLSVDMNKNK